MNANKERHLGLRIGDDLLYKLHFVSEYEGRSTNGHILYLIRQSVMDFEAKHGNIVYPPKEED